jgi:hypothetical protein
MLTLFPETEMAREERGERRPHQDEILEISRIIVVE